MQNLVSKTHGQCSHEAKQCMSLCSLVLCAYVQELSVVNAQATKEPDHSILEVICTACTRIQPMQSRP